MKRRLFGKVYCQPSNRREVFGQATIESRTKNRRPRSGEEVRPVVGPSVLDRLLVQEPDAMGRLPIHARRPHEVIRVVD